MELCTTGRRRLGEFTAVTMLRGLREATGIGSIVGARRGATTWSSGFRLKGNDSWYALGAVDLTGIILSALERGSEPKDSRLDLG